LAAAGGLELHHDLIRNLLGSFDVATEATYFIHAALQSANDANKSEADHPFLIKEPSPHAKAS
jgi:hypothetical protein